MMTDENEIATIPPSVLTPAADLPDFMTPEDVEESTEGMNEYIVPPRIKVVQALSKTLTDEFNPGDTILLPQRVMVAPVLLNEQSRPLKETSNSGEKWHFVTLFRYTEWISWNPRELSDEDAIRYRTINRQDPVVAKCRDSKLWSEKHERTDANGKDLFIRHCEHLNFIVMPIDTAIAGTPVCMSFSRSEHKVGSTFLSLIKMRKAPMYGCIFEASAGFRENQQGEWYGVDVRNPSEEIGPLVQNAEDYALFKKTFNELKDAHAKGQIQVDLEDDGETLEPADSPTEF